MNYQLDFFFQSSCKCPLSTFNFDLYFDKLQTMSNTRLFSATARLGLEFERRRGTDIKCCQRHGIL